MRAKRVLILYLHSLSQAAARSGSENQSESNPLDKRMISFVEVKVSCTDHDLYLVITSIELLSLQKYQPVLKLFSQFNMPFAIHM